MPQLKECCIFVRVSSTLQDWERQVRDLTKVAIKEGYVVLDDNIYDEKVSGSKVNVNRVGLDKMLLDLRGSKKHIRKIYCMEVTRLGRRPSVTRRIIDDLMDEGINIYIDVLRASVLLENGDVNEEIEHRVQENIISGKNEIKLLVLRLKSGKENAVKNVKTVGKNAYGYYSIYTQKVKGAVPGVDEKEAETVRKIFELAIAGQGVRAISNYLTSQNILARNGKAFDQSVIHDIILNPIYYGSKKYNDELFQGYPIIIEKDIWDAANAAVISRKNNFRGNKRNIWLLPSSMLKCTCGLGLSPITAGGSTAIRNPKGQIKYYSCYGKRTIEKTCEAKGFNIPLLDGLVWTVVKQNLSLYTFLKNSSSELEQVKKDVISMKGDLTSLDFEINKKKTIRKNRMLQQAEGLLTIDELKSELLTIDNVLKNLEKKHQQINKDIEAKEQWEVKFNSQKEFAKTVKDIDDSRLKIAEVLKNVVDKVIAKCTRIGNNRFYDVQIFMFGNPVGVNGVLHASTQLFYPSLSLQDNFRQFDLNRNFRNYETQASVNKFKLEKFSLKDIQPVNDSTLAPKISTTKKVNLIIEKININVNVPIYIVPIEYKDVEHLQA